MPHETALSAAAARLCLDCGLCCNGVLFDQVMLQPEDHAKALAARGLKIKKKQFFTQPCAALCGALCTVYEDRPTRCRLFVCRQFKQVAAGKIQEADARARITEARRLVARVEALLQRTADDNLRKSLSQRFANALALEPASGDETPPDCAELAAAMEELQAALTEHFRVA